MTPTETMKVCAMTTCATGRCGVTGPHIHGNMVRQVADDQDKTQRGGTNGPHAHGNTARSVVDDLNAEGTGQQKTVKPPPQQPAQPQYANYWALLMWKKTTRNTGRSGCQNSDPTQHAKGRTGDCPGPRKETATQRDVTQGVRTPPSWTHQPPQPPSYPPTPHLLFEALLASLRDQPLASGVSPARQTSERTQSPMALSQSFESPFLGDMEGEDDLFAEEEGTDDEEAAVMAQHLKMQQRMQQAQEQVKA